jgi:hypothetical protein
LSIRFARGRKLHWGECSLMSHSVPQTNNLQSRRTNSMERPLGNTL